MTYNNNDIDLISYETIDTINNIQNDCVPITTPIKRSIKHNIQTHRWLPSRIINCIINQYEFYLINVNINDCFDFMIQWLILDVIPCLPYEIRNDKRLINEHDNGSTILALEIYEGIFIN